MPHIFAKNSGEVYYGYFLKSIEYGMVYGGHSLCSKKKRKETYKNILSLPYSSKYNYD